MADSAPSDRRRLIIDLVLLFILASAWSSAFLFNKYGLRTLPPMTLAGSRILIAAGLLFLLARWRGERLPATWADWRAIAIVGTLTITFPVALFTWGQQTVDTGRAAIMVSTLSLWTLGFAYASGVEDRLTLARILGIVLGFSGVVLLVGPTALDGVGDHLLGQIAVLLAPACYGAGLVMARRLPPGTPVVRSAAVMFVASACLVPVCLIVDAPWRLDPSGVSIFAAIYLGIIPTSSAMILSFHLIATRGATFTSLANYVTPGLAVILGAIFLNERITLELAAAMAVILAGVAIASLKRGPKKP